MWNGYADQGLLCHTWIGRYLHTNHESYEDADYLGVVSYPANSWTCQKGGFVILTTYIHYNKYNKKRLNSYYPGHYDETNCEECRYYIGE